MNVSVEALAALRKGRNAWDEWRSLMRGRIDLSMASLDGANLRGFQFEDCDFAGSDANGASFDDVSFRECSFTSMSMAHASFVGAQFDNCRLSDCNLDRATFRSTEFTHTELRDLAPGRFVFYDCQFTSSSIEAPAQGARFAFEECWVSDARLMGFSGELGIRQTTISNSQLSELNLDDWTMAGTEIRDCDLRSVISRSHRWYDVVLDDTDLHAVDVGIGDSIDVVLLSCRILRSDLAHLGIHTIALADAMLVDCQWPNQRPMVSWSGRHVSAPGLMRQPVQDVSGVDPIRRRQVADAQYLRALHEQSVDRRSRRIMLRLWGLSSGFGQSVSRLLSWIAIVIAALTLLRFGIANMESVGWRPTMRLLSPASAIADLAASWAEVTGSFFGFTDRKDGEPWPLSTVYWAARLAGFAALGVVIGIAGTRMGRLSSE